ASNPIVQLFEGTVTFYSPVRDIICFKDNKQDYCLVNSIENILAIINTIINFFNANPEAYDILAKAANIGEQDMELIEKFLAVKCGQQFEN
ncbi:14195_t:CDS:2, partial [Racocetra fulgida]